MSYTEPAPADLIARFPAFAAVTESIIQDALDEASNRVDSTWEDADAPIAIMLLACHNMSLDGLGSGVVSQIAQMGALGFQTMKSGSLTLSGPRLSKASSPSAILADLQQTPYGIRFRSLLALNSPPVTTV
jgi:hypothetical protein